MRKIKYKHKFRSLLELTKYINIRSDRQPCSICEIVKFIKINQPNYNIQAKVRFTRFIGLTNMIHKI